MSRVFISSPHSERELAHDLARRLENKGLFPVMDYFESSYADDWLHHILYSVESSDAVILIIPADDYERNWVSRRFNKILRYKLKSRNILVVPVYLGKKRFISGSIDQVAFNIESEGVSQNQKKYSEESIKRLVEYFANISKVDFDRLSSNEFEGLIAILLERLDFFDVERQGYQLGHGFDILAKTETRNPFGGVGFTSWAIEIKYSKNSRADIRSLRQLSHFLEESPLDVNGVLITNGQLTSTLREWLEFNEKEKRTSITIVDGIKLKQLTLQHPDLVEEYFGGHGASYE